MSNGIAGMHTGKSSAKTDCGTSSSQKGQHGIRPRRVSTRHAHQNPRFSSAAVLRTNRPALLVMNATLSDESLNRAFVMDEVEKVIASNMCVGCGSCAFAQPDLYQMQMTPAGLWKAQRTTAERKSDAIAVRVCPMAGASPDETEIAGRLYPELPHDPQIGRYLDTFAAHVSQGEYRQHGGSGGLVSWLLAELFRRGDIDAVLHVKAIDAKEQNGVLFEYAVSESESAMCQGAKSRYYPIEMSGVLHRLRDPSKRYAVVGLPCFIKSIRLMQKENLFPGSPPPFCIGLVCGHLKSRHFSEYLAWQKGAAPGSVTAFNFRHKLMDRRASDYGFSYRYRQDAQTISEAVWPMASVNGRDWGEGMFKNPACEYCDDVLAECADVVIGDAWLPNYVKDPLGTNVVVTRHKHLHAVIQAGADSGAVVVGPADVDAVIRSQSSGLRHRREGLAHRLARKVQRGEWAPVKRVAPALAPTRYRRAIYDSRLKIAETSAAMYGDLRQAGQPLAEFEKRIAPLLSQYRKAIRREARGGFKGLVRKIANRLQGLLSRP